MPEPIRIIIPARWQSSRFPGKPLANICGANGQPKSLIQRSHEAASLVGSRETIWVATDDERIASAVRDFGGQVVMTSEFCRNGTERVAEAAQTLGKDALYVNFQGDALLTPPDMVRSLVKSMQARADCPVATVAVRASPSTYRHLIEDQHQGRVGGTTVVCAGNGQALYFSKRVIPHIPPGDKREAAPPVLLHLGLYAYRPTGLDLYMTRPVTEIEEIEGLEQLRFLHYNIPMLVVTCEAPDWDVIELNNPSDLPLIEAILAARGID